jgi:hypothetical protein
MVPEIAGGELFCMGMVRAHHSRIVNKGPFAEILGICCDLVDKKKEEGKRNLSLLRIYRSD